MVRNWVSAASTGALVTKVVGNYNIVNNVLHFVDAPFGNKPTGGATNPPDQRDYVELRLVLVFRKNFLKKRCFK